VHVVPYTDPNSADGYGSNQLLPPVHPIPGPVHLSTVTGDRCRVCIA
jgi:hypothetical protein